jgi:methionine-rich copper-binding protein CopC
MTRYWSPGNNGVNIEINSYRTRCSLRIRNSAMQNAMTRFFAAIVASLMGIAGAGAHAVLDHAVPSAGGTISTSPPTVRLSFSERVEPAFSGAELSTAEGQSITTPAAIIDSGDGARLVLHVPPLAPGRYKVTWHIVSADTHRTHGDYVFEIKP